MLPSLPYKHQLYCSQVGLHQSLFPLPVDGRSLRLSFNLTTNYFLPHYLFCDKETERELTFELLNGNPFTVLEVWHDRLERSKQQYQTMSEVFDYIRGTVEKEFMLKKIKGTRSKR